MNKLARNTLALGTATLIVTAGLSFSANGADKIVAQAESSAITATGLTQILNSNVCRAESTGPANPGAGTCGVGLGISQPAVATFTQTASTDLVGSNGRSTATAEIATTGINALTTIDLSNLGTEVGTIDTGTILDPLVQGLDPVTKPLFEAILTPLLTAVQANVLTPVLTALQDNLPVSVLINGVTSKCEATAGTTTTGTSSVAGINIVVDLPPGSNDLIIPITLGTGENVPLVGAVGPQALVDGLLDGVEDTLTSSLDDTLGDVLLGPLAGLIVQVRAALLTPLLDAVGDAILAPVGQAIDPILNGTLNKRTPGADGSLEVTALDLNLLGTAATLDLARVKCGPNSAVVVTTPPPTKTTPTPTKSTPTKDSDDSDSQADSDADGTTPVNNVDDSDTIADADAQADADVTTTLPSTGAPNLLPFWMLGIALLMFGGAVLVNEKRRLNQI